MQLDNPSITLQCVTYLSSRVGPILFPGTVGRSQATPTANNATSAGNSSDICNSDRHCQPLV